MRFKTTATLLSTGALGALAGRYYLKWRDDRLMVQRTRAELAAIRGGKETFHEGLTASLPEPVRRYFRHAIAPGTRLTRRVELEMNGQFNASSEGDRWLPMQARQVLAPGAGFVWEATVGSGFMTLRGADTLKDDDSLVAFWLHRLIPMVRESASPDLVRSAWGRAIEEYMWNPAGLLLDDTIQWEAPDDHTIRFSVQRLDFRQEVTMTLDATGRVIEVVAPRWGNVNDGKTYELIPFGGTLEADTTFNGFTIPSSLTVGWHFGTERYRPFFKATITRAIQY